MEKNPNPTFFKIIFPLPRMSEQMRIPPEFVKHIDKRAFKKAMLRDSSGRTWPVKLHENKKGVFVKDGWDRFFKAHSLGNFDFLTFTYDGETCFDVEIFGRDGVNKLEDDNGSNESISFEHRSGQDDPHRLSSELQHLRVTKNSKNNKEIQIIGSSGQDVPYRGSRELKQPIMTKSSKNNMKVVVQTIESSDEEVPYRLKDTEYEKVYQSNEDMHAIVKASCTKPVVEKRKRGRPLGSKNKKIGQGLVCYEPNQSKKLKEEKELSIDIKEETIDLCDKEPGFGSKKFNTSKGNNASRNASQSNFPFFKICIDLDDADNKYMISLPKPFVKKYFPCTETTMVLKNEKGKSWQVKFFPGGNCFIGGWPEFLRDNELKHGDRCNFELVKKKEMKVYIFRSENDG